MLRLPVSRFGRIAFFIAIALVLGGLLGGSVAYLWVAHSLPRVETLADYRPPIVTRVFSDDGTQVAEFSRERRIVVSATRMPKQLIHAFVSAEDANFFQHTGIDFVSILRAAIKNVLAGGIVQGGSTITQQVAKSLLLTPEKKFSRKFKEAILAWRMEQALSKDEILTLYLNQIFLGHGSYGVQAAAENYFDKNIDQLNLAECALLAGLPQAPSRYSPYQHLEKARERQKYVLGRMVEEKYITRAQADAALAYPIVIRPRVNPNASAVAYFTEQVRRYLEETYGAELLYTGGLQVYTTMNLRLQRAAQDAVRQNLRDHDKRRSLYRGPLRVLAEKEEKTFLDKQEGELAADPPAPGEIHEAVVIGLTGKVLNLRLGNRRAELPLESAAWAGPIRLVSRVTPARGNLHGGATLLPPGAVITVQIDAMRDDGVLKVLLEQEPEAQGALVAIDPGNGQIKALVGGYDFRRSHFNRAIQAKRLPGSAIKPLIYAAALDKGYTPATVILDAPLVYRSHNEAGEEIEWRPQNYGHEFGGPTSMRSALAKSNNMVTIRILEEIGVDYAAEYARRLGLTSPLARDLTFALGSSAVTPLELATAYTTFASGGIRITPGFIRRIVDRDGHVLASVDAADFPTGPGPDQRLLQPAAERVISAETAYLITNMMESVIREGTGAKAQALERPAAGKTGTTNDLKDAWFAGFIPQLVAVTWVGYDQERPLGDRETGSQAAAPGWVSFMQTAARYLPPLDFTVPDTIEFHNIDPQTGLLAPEDAPLHIEAFAPGTAPTRSAIEARRPQAKDFYRKNLDDE